MTTKSSPTTSWKSGIEITARRGRLGCKPEARNHQGFQVPPYRCPVKLLVPQPFPPFCTPCDKAKLLPQAAPIAPHPMWGSLELEADRRPADAKAVHRGSFRRGEVGSPACKPAVGFDCTASGSPFHSQLALLAEVRFPPRFVMLEPGCGAPADADVAVGDAGLDLVGKVLPFGV